MNTREHKIMIKLGFLFFHFHSFLFKTAHFGHMLKISSHLLFWCMVTPLGPHSVYT